MIEKFEKKFLGTWWVNVPDPELENIQFNRIYVYKIFKEVLRREIQGLKVQPVYRY